MNRHPQDEDVKEENTAEALHTFFIVMRITPIL